MENTVENKKAKLNVLKFIFLLVLFNSLINTNLNRSNGFGAYIATALLLLLIGCLLGSVISKYSAGIMKIAVILAAFSIYLAMGAGLLQYCGEGGQMKDFKKGTLFTYGVQFDTGLKVPAAVDYVLPLGQKGLTLISHNTSRRLSFKKTEYNYGLALTFKVTEDRANLPRKLLVVYRGFKIIPMVNIIELSWAEYVD